MTADNPQNMTSRQAMQFTDWLRQNGELKNFKEKRKILEQAGMPKYKAWRAAAADYGWHPKWKPSETDQLVIPGKPKDQIIDLPGNFKPEEIPEEQPDQSLQAAFQWVLHNIDAPFDEAPTPLAKYLLNYAYEAQSDFINKAIKFLSTQKDKSKQALLDDQRDQLNRLKKLETRCPHCNKIIP